MKPWPNTGMTMYVSSGLSIWKRPCWRRMVLSMCERYAYWVNVSLPLRSRIGCLCIRTRFSCPCLCVSSTHSFLYLAWIISSYIFIIIYKLFSAQEWRGKEGLAQHRNQEGVLAHVCPSPVCKAIANAANSQIIYVYKSTQPSIFG
jgi:hypothetical protein